MIRYNPSAQYNGISDTKIAVLSILAIVVAFAAFGLLGTFKLVTQYFGPPLVLDEQRLAASTARDAPFFNAQINQVSANAIGFSESTYDLTGKIDGTTRYFGFLGLGNYVIIIKTRTPVQSRILDYSGVVTHVSDDSNVLDLYNDVIRRNPSSQDVLLPFVLDTDYDVSPWFAGLAFEVVLLAAGAGGLFIVWRRHFED
jgi:hypothetical protein